MKKLFSIFLVTILGAFSFPFYIYAIGARIDPKNLPDATEDDYYYYGPLTASGGTLPYTWLVLPDLTTNCTPYSNASGNNLNFGLSLSPTGIISATKIIISNRESYIFPIKNSFIIGLKDANGSCGISIRFTITINPATGSPIPTAGAPSITSVSPLQPGAIVNQQYQYQFTASGGTEQYQWFFGSTKTLPPEFYPFLSTGGMLSLTPTKIGSHEFEVIVKDLGQAPGFNQNSRTFTLFVGSGQEIQISSPKNGLPNQLYSETIYITNGIPPYSTEITKPITWLTAIVSSGSQDKITPQGTPPQIGNYLLSIKVKDGGGKEIVKDIPITITSSVPPPPAGPAAGSGASMKRSCEGEPLIIKNPNLYQATSTKDGWVTMGYDGLVPCGKCVVTKAGKVQDVKDQMKKDATNTLTSAGLYSSCQFCHFFVMFGGIVNFLLLKIAVPAAILLLVIGGAMFVFAAGNPGMIKKGGDIMKSVAIGLIIMFTAWIVVSTILSLIGVASWTGLRNGWFGINCPINI